MQLESVRDFPYVILRAGASGSVAPFTYLRIQCIL